MQAEAVENAPGRIALAMKLLRTLRVPINALAAHSTHPKDFPAERLQEAGLAAEVAADNLKKVFKLLSPLADKDLSAAPQPEELDLADLATHEALQPEYGYLRAALQRALIHAENIDIATGNAFPDKIGGSCGHDLAEEVVQLMAKVDRAAGATGKGLE